MLDDISGDINHHQIKEPIQRKKIARVNNSNQLIFINALYAPVQLTL